ncbi:Beta-taxilin [Dissostichus eleginoides]|uniref:Beta-taxilin n=1 Tax=Dissostichus eleginoides TaxID=100907 RepID=A0AAD9BL24_DISEL|nr:Beta-taxilin [Dissostichus eleginoides]
MLVQTPEVPSGPLALTGGGLGGSGSVLGSCGTGKTSGAQEVRKDGGLHLTPSLPPSPRSCPLSLTRAPPQSQGVVSLPARLPDSPTSPPHPLRGDRLPIRNAAVATLPAPPL